jgi:RimJ/RimL family protein N-acetyltransferase
MKLPFTFATPLATERLTLRLMTEADVDDVYAYRSRVDVCRYLLFEPQTREQVATSLAKYAKAATLTSDGDYWQLAIELEVDERRRVIGDIYLTVKSVENQSFEIGWTMHPDFHGRGYASEAASAVLGLCFTEMDGHRVLAELDPRNGASIALCKRLGMREEAFHLEDLWFRGAWADTGIYAILQREYRA